MKQLYFKQIFKPKPIWIILAAIILYISYFSFFTLQKHELFFTGRYDLGNMDQTVWNTSQGRILQFTNPDFDQVMSRLSVHSDFILILLAPLYLLWPDARVLLLTQTIVIASGAIFIYLLSKKILSTPYNLPPTTYNFIPLTLSLSYLLNPYLQRQNIFDFHPVSLATTFLLGAFYFLKTNHTSAFFIFLTLAVLTKEHIFLIAAIFGIYIFLTNLHKKNQNNSEFSILNSKLIVPLLLTLFSCLIFYLLVSVFIPQARGETHFALSSYQNLGDSPTQIILTTLTNPLSLIKIFLEHDILSYLKTLFMPIGYLPLISPLYFLFALPEFLINTLSTNNAYRSYYYHYSAASIPFIYISTIFAIKKLLSIRHLPSATCHLLPLYLLSFSLLSAWYFGPLPGARKSDIAIFQTNLNPKPIHNYLQQIPSETPVAASNNLAAHLVHRQKIYTPINGMKKADLILFLNTDKYDRNQNLQLINQLKTNPSFQIEYQLDNFIVFKRKNNQ